MLSQVRYERKFIIAKDQALYREFLKFKGDFERYLDEAMGVADPKLAALLNQIKQDYDHYHELFDKRNHADQGASRIPPRLVYAREKPNYGQDSGIIGTAKSREAARYLSIRLRELADAGARAREAAVTITITSLLFILVLSLLIARSITRPISVLKNKTREIAKGRFEGDLRLSSPPRNRGTRSFV